MGWTKKEKSGFLLYHSSTFLEWEKEFKEIFNIPYLYNKFTANKVPSISFDVSFQGSSPSSVPACGAVRGQVFVKNHIFTVDPIKLQKGVTFGIDVISQKLVRFFRDKELVIDPASFTIHPVQEFTPADKKECLFVHICEFRIVNIFELPLLKEPKDE